MNELGRLVLEFGDAEGRGPKESIAYLLRRVKGGGALEVACLGSCWLVSLLVGQGGRPPGRGRVGHGEGVTERLCRGWPSEK